jgi:hypothetical protein
VEAALALSSGRSWPRDSVRSRRRPPHPPAPRRRSLTRRVG